MNDQSPNQSKTVSWFKSMRATDALELMRANPHAFNLAYVIAYRARYREGFNADGLEQGEAMLGDYQNYGMSQRQYRTAKQNLENWHFATFRTTNKGTLGKLIDTRLFDPLNISGDEQNDKQPTSKRQTTDEQPTTNKKDKKEEEGGKNMPLGFENLKSWQLNKDLQRLEGQIRYEQERVSPDAELIDGLKSERALIKAEIKRRNEVNDHVVISSPVHPTVSKAGETKNDVSEEDLMKFRKAWKDAVDSYQPNPGKQ